MLSLPAAFLVLIKQYHGKTSGLDVFLDFSNQFPSFLEIRKIRITLYYVILLFIYIFFFLEIIITNM